MAAGWWSRAPTPNCWRAMAVRRTCIAMQFRDGNGPADRANAVAASPGVLVRRRCRRCPRACCPLYASVTALRRKAYARGWLRSRKAGAPVVVVGNITAGGTGKTPLVIAWSRLACAGLNSGRQPRPWPRRRSRPRAGRCRQRRGAGRRRAAVDRARQRREGAGGLRSRRRRARAGGRRL